LRRELIGTNLFRFIVTVDFDAEEPPLVVPVQSDVRNVEKVFDPDFLSRRDLQDCDPSGYFIPFWKPEGQHIGGGGPDELTENKHQASDYLAIKTRTICKGVFRMTLLPLIRWYQIYHAWRHTHAEDFMCCCK